MLQKIKTNFNLQKILLSLSIGVVMNLFWLIIIFIIGISTPMSDEMIPVPFLERTPVAYMYYWLDMFLPANVSKLAGHDLLIFLSNTILYFALSYFFLSLFKSDQNNTGKIISVLIGILMNPLLIFIIFIIDGGSFSGLFPLSIFHGTPFGYMFCWSIVILPEHPIDLRAATLLPLVLNPVLYFFLNYGLLRLLSRLTNRPDKLT